MRALALVLALLAPPAALAQSEPPGATADAAGIAGETPRIVADIDQTDVSINSTFAGSEILVFGSIQDGGPGTDVIVTVAGPPRPVTVRRLGRLGPIWANTASADIPYPPTFYAVASSSPLGTVLPLADDIRHRITAARAVRADGDSSDFVEALLRLREANGSYLRLDGAVELRESALFRTTIPLPSALTEGDYTVRIFLLEKGVVAQGETTLLVRKVGLERLLYNMAKDRPYLYGIMSLAIAIGAGWAASAAFAAFRR